MDKKSEKAILRAKLENYRLLSIQFPDGMTAKNIRLLSAEVEQELRKPDVPRNCEGRLQSRADR